MITATFSGCLGFGDGKSSIFDDEPTPLKINHIQVKGTHNSYHIKPFGPTARAYEYTHEPLDVQAGEFDVRQFELDVITINTTSEAPAIFSLIAWVC